MNVYVILGLIFAFVFSLSMAVIFLLSGKDKIIKARLEKLKNEKESRAQRLTSKISIIKQLMEILGFDSERPSSVAQSLIQAGYHKQQSIYNYYAAQLAFALLLGVAGLVASFQFDLESSQTIVAAFGGILGGIWLPKLWVGRKIKQRSEQIRKAIPHVLDLMVVSVEAGMSFTAAIQKMAEEIRVSCKPLSEELQIVTQEILIGQTKADAFRNLATRTGVEDLRALATTLIQADKLGTSIANSLRVQADSMRYKRQQRAEEQANKMSIKLLFPLIFLIFPQLLLVVVGPAVINIARHLANI